MVSGDRLETWGVRMDTVSKLNSRPLKIYFQREGESKGKTPVITAHENFQ